MMLILSSGRKSALHTSGQARYFNLLLIKSKNLIYKCFINSESGKPPPENDFTEIPYRDLQKAQLTAFPRDLQGAHPPTERFHRKVQRLPLHK